MHFTFLIQMTPLCGFDGLLWLVPLSLSVFENLVTPSLARPLGSCRRNYVFILFIKLLCVRQCAYWHEAAPPFGVEGADLYPNVLCEMAKGSS